MMLTILSLRTIRGTSVNSKATRATTPKDTKPMNAPLALRKTAMATMGKNSPTAPAAMMSAPNRPSSRWLSRRMGKRVPSAVVVKPRAIGTNAVTSPAAARAAVTPTATTAVTSQEMIASRPARSRKRLMSSS